MGFGFSDLSRIRIGTTQTGRLGSIRQYLPHKVNRRRDRKDEQEAWGLLFEVHHPRTLDSIRLELRDCTRTQIAATATKLLTLLDITSKRRTSQSAVFRCKNCIMDIQDLSGVLPVVGLQLNSRESKDEKDVKNHQRNVIKMSIVLRRMKPFSLIFAKRFSSVSRFSSSKLSRNMSNAFNLALNPMQKIYPSRLAQLVFWRL
ncbi:hypothetical protein KIN20_004079 [Parelaphostrongylus tenuis]|uniref:Uncharacterized protein n=1 Tax=Parelaphostrongylus tenuis TaxID=148309 RepID=A0AAD5M177_PARTN|nr:hypothetical protein KIN20_004079 [Parelaphostrongylus tenuis]